MPRKKYSIDIHPEVIALRSGSNFEHLLSIKELAHVLVVPSPEKPNVYNVVLLTKKGSNKVEDFIFTINDDEHGIDAECEASSTTTTSNSTKGKDWLCAQLNRLLKLTVIQPVLEVFSGAKKVPHIQCYQKAKEGSLYAMPEGIFFGFKKPLLFIPMHHIKDIGIGSKTTRNFDLDVTTTTTKHNFSMIQIEELMPINYYITKFKKGAFSAPKSGHGGPVGAAAADDDEDSDVDEDYRPGYSSESPSDDDDDIGDEEDDTDDDPDKPYETGFGDEEDEVSDDNGNKMVTSSVSGKADKKKGDDGSDDSDESDDA
jgi:hypothetical protein